MTWLDPKSIWVYRTAAHSASTHVCEAANALPFPRMDLGTKHTTKSMPIGMATILATASILSIKSTAHTTFRESR